MTSLNLRPIASSSSSSKSNQKPIPSPSSLAPWDFSYSPSPDGHDKNLLIMFHGLGDSKIPFFNLGKQLNLPSTAILSLSAPDPIPLMDKPSFSWYKTFTSEFDLIPTENQNPTIHLTKLRSLLIKLNSTELGGWKLNEIHLFGFGQGSTISLELCLFLNKNPIENQERFGSIISICGSLLSFQSEEQNQNNKLKTPLCFFTRYNSNSKIYKKQIMNLKRVFQEIIEIHATSRNQNQEEGIEKMPENKEEWWEIMKFWGQILNRKSDDQGWKGSGEVYEVIR
ncbi:uncharacterized protein I206_105347 [Kwoniella pini CBS 10737]|uniref:Phospholipase/carboxylesterase/thioesterase domain-containing protein n=1 Tax=Kwoniella pini CBS 10737 TaxID=1296096 RepID=A0A1B9I4H2_9TREE|nr:uncharacterized protein I206_03743 [Kwoniella pini CBS 10737]OCF50421.1 hypothetical protein I206_03743 [Kwoniella pini CBS 10737]